MNKVLEKVFIRHNVRDWTNVVGRGGNSWTSPAGCLMFSFLTKVKEGTLLPFFQYLISLALVRAIKEYPHEESLQNLPIQIKWPNDIYSGNQKICGVLCNSEYFEKEFHIISGVGINVSNCEPTTCINQLLQNAKYCLFSLKVY